MADMQRVDGRDAGPIVLYALSTCVWCRKTREMLDALGVAYSYVYVDKLAQREQDEVMEEVARRNPRRSFPTLVLADGETICGFDEKAVRKALG